MQDEHAIQEQEGTQVPSTAGNGSLPEEDLAINNLLEQVRLRRRELLEARQTYITIPGYDDLGLVAQYHLLDGKQLNMIGEKVNRQTKDRVTRGLYAAADQIIAACDGLYLERDGEYVPFDPYHTGVAMTFGPELARFLELGDVDNARSVVYELFGNNDSALAMHVYKLSRWFQDTTRDADEEILGEV